MNVLIQVGITALSSVETLLDLTSVLALVATILEKMVSVVKVHACESLMYIHCTDYRISYASTHIIYALVASLYFACVRACVRVCVCVCVASSGLPW